MKHYLPIILLALLCSCGNQSKTNIITLTDGSQIVETDNRISLPIDVDTTTNSIIGIEVIDDAAGLLLKSPIKLNKMSLISISYSEDVPYTFEWYHFAIADKEDGKYIYKLERKVKKGYAGFVEKIGLSLYTEDRCTMANFKLDEARQYLPNFVNSLKE